MTDGLKKALCKTEYIIAKSAGFCFGVQRAVKMAETLASGADDCVTLGPLIHNPGVIRELAERGVVPIDSPDEASPGQKVILRSHGVDPATIEKLEKRGARIVDATCPFVKRIHRMVQEAFQKRITVYVVGEKEHPEVQGILGWAGGYGKAVLSVEEAMREPLIEKALIVSQTTLPQSVFREVSNALSTRIAHPEIRNTICPATEERQREAIELAAHADRMLVVGGRNSANTRKLYMLCRERCEDTHLIESAEELSAIKSRWGIVIGMTAGASTPVCIFKEVVERMNDIEKQEQVQAVTEATETAATTANAEAISPEDDFMAGVEKTLVQLRPGQTVTGTVLQINDEEVCVNVGYKADGLIKKSDLSSTDVKVGDEIEVEVVKVNDGEGNVLLSQRNIVDRKNWDEIMARYENGEFVEGIGKEAVKGGLLANVNGVRTFIPASQLAQHYVEKISDFVGQELKLKIIEVDKAKKRIVASRKQVLQAEAAERKKEVWAKLEVGQELEGTVRRLTDFGAFVDIGGVDGLVHVTDLAWHRVKHPSEIVSVNQKIPVRILALDPEKERISLSYKATQPRPWDVAGEKYVVGSVVEGKVVRITTFGAFVELEPGLDGLVHISQCALTRIAKVEDAVNVGDIIRVKILDVNTEARRISLSIRAVLEDEAFDGLNSEENTPEDEYAIGEEPVEVAAEEPAEEAVQEPAAEAAEEAVQEEPAQTAEE